MILDDAFARLVLTLIRQPLSTLYGLFFYLLIHYVLLTSCAY